MRLLDKPALTETSCNCGSFLFCEITRIEDKKYHHYFCKSCGFSTNIQIYHKGRCKKMSLNFKEVEYIPASQNKTTQEYEDTIKQFKESKVNHAEITIPKDCQPTTIASALRRSLNRMNIDNIVVKQRNFKDGVKVYIEKVKIVNGKKA